jgi:hypothetical protein
VGEPVGDTVGVLVGDAVGEEVGDPVGGRVFSCESNSRVSVPVHGMPEIGATAVTSVVTIYSLSVHTSTTDG